MVKFTSDIAVELIQHCGDDATISAAARVSTKGDRALEQPGNDTSNGHLINYLMKHRHGSPFEHAMMTFRVNAPIFVWREWHRHRIGFSYNEESARYKQLEPVFYLPPEDRPMFRVEGWKPGRPKFLTIEEESVRCENANRLFDSWREEYKAQCGIGYRVYERALEFGLDPGMARDILPVGIMSSCWVTCNPRSLMAFLSLRTHDESAMFASYPLYEIEVAARKLESIFQTLFPITHKAFCINGRVGP